MEVYDVPLLRHLDHVVFNIPQPNNKDKKIRMIKFKQLRIQYFYNNIEISNCK
jgi:hypothetical protein